MNTILIEFLLGLYFVGVSLPQLLESLLSSDKPKTFSKNAAFTLTFGLFLWAVAFFGLSLLGR